MKKKTIIALLMSIACLVSCAEAPDEVKQQNSILDRAETASKTDSTSSDLSSLEDTMNYDLKTLDEIRASIDKDLADNQTNVVVKNVRVPESSAMPVFMLQKNFDNYDKIDNIIDDYFGTGASNHKERLMSLTRFHSVFEMTEKLSLNFDGCKGALVYTDPNNMANHVSSSGCGYFMAINTGNSLVEPYSGELIEAYDLRKGDTFPNDKHKMSDGTELSIPEAIKMAEETANKYIAQLYTDKTTVKVYRVEVYNREAGGCGYAMLAEYCDAGGNLFLANDRANLDMDAFLMKTTPLIPVINLGLSVEGTIRPPRICANSVPAVSEVTENGDKLMSLGDAIGVVSTKLAGASVYNMDCATLEYVITAPYSDKYVEYSTAEDGEVSKKFFKELYEHIPETNYEARPFWVFRDFEKNPENIGEIVYGGIYLVDALNGKLYVA